MAAALDISERTVFRAKRRYAEEGLDEVLRHRNQVNRYQTVDDRVEAHLIALTSSPVPEGHDHWTLRALAGRVVELGLVEPLSPETVRLRLKKHPQAVAEATVVHSRCIPKVSSEYVAAMEDVLDLYSEPYDPERPVVCFDDLHPASGGHQRTVAGTSETGGLRVPEGRDPKPVPHLRAPGRMETRGGDRAAYQGGLCPPDAVVGGRGLPRGPGDTLGVGQLEHPSRGVLIRDIPSSRGPAHRQEAGISPHAQAWQLAEPCPELAEGMAEIEFSVLARACFKGRNADEDVLQRSISACETERNYARATINWRFTTKHARAKMSRLYPDTPPLT